MQSGMKFKFTCLTCGKPYEERVKGELLEIYLDIQEDTHQEVLQGECPECKATRKAKDNQQRLQPHVYTPSPASIRMDLGRKDGQPRSPVAQGSHYPTSAP